MSKNTEFNITITRLDEFGNETPGEIVKTFASSEEAEEYVCEHEQDFADDPEIYAVYIEKDERELEPAKLSKIPAERLEVLLYNAIVCLEEYGCYGEQLAADIGISEEEWDAIFNADEKLSLDTQVQSADVQKEQNGGLFAAPTKDIDRER